EDRLPPWAHLLALVTGQVPELLTADGEQGPEHDDLLLLLPLEHRLQPRAQRQGRFAGSGASAERDDADLRVEQQVDRDALLSRAAVHAEQFAVAAHQPVLAVLRDAPEGRAALGGADQAGVYGQPAGLLACSGPSLAQTTDVLAG